MDAMPPSPPAEVRQVDADCTPARPCLLRVEAFVGALPATTKHDAPHRHDHALGSRLVAPTSPSTDGPRTAVIAAPDHLEHAVDAASDQIAAELAELKDISYYVNGHLMQVYRVS